MQADQADSKDPGQGSEKSRPQGQAWVCHLLATLLADEHIVFMRARSYRWNVVGPQFGDLHGVFGHQATEVNQLVDRLAERLRALGSAAPGTLAEFVQLARLREYPGHNPPAREMVLLLLQDHETMAASIRQDLLTLAQQHHDPGTQLVLTQILECHESLARYLRAFVEEPRTAH